MNNLKHSFLQLLVTLLFVIVFSLLCTCAVTTAQTGASGWRFPAPGWVTEFESFDVEDDKRHANITLTSTDKAQGVAPVDVPCPPER